MAGNAGEAGLIPTTDRYGAALADIARCRRCGHMQLAPMPDEALLLQEYATAESADYLAEEPGQRATAARVLAEIERYVGPGRLLDLGCWVGFFLAEARDRGWAGTGVEPSEFASGHAREQLQLEVLTADLFAAELPEGAFEAVFMGDVIEHLPDPGAGLALAREALVSDGVLALALPDAGSRVARILGRRWWSVIPTHVQYFTRGSMCTLLEAQGFKVLRLTTAPKTFSLSYYLSRLGGYARSASDAAVRATQALNLADRLVTPDLRDRMLVLARPR